MARGSSVRRVLGMLMLAVAGLAGDGRTLAAQESRVLGRVTDGVGNGLAEARVTLVPEDSGSARQEAVSGRSGGFQFDAVAPGTYTLRAQRDGYTVREQRITVRPGRVVTPVVRLAGSGRTARASLPARTARN
ncbi:MAG TPA: carboxypeptidase-like regulatory domain-containing protein [Longimicrobium sp.]|nr:carboxypeptidase-like regulatory domain-containing protein [Longimicrobium sp.]